MTSTPRGAVPGAAKLGVNMLLMRGDTLLAVLLTPEPPAAAAAAAADAAAADAAAIWLCCQSREKATIK